MDLRVATNQGGADKTDVPDEALALPVRLCLLSFGRYLIP